MVPGYPHEAAAGVGVGVGAGASHDTNQEDEWKNIKVVSWLLKHLTRSPLQ